MLQRGQDKVLVDGGWFIKFHILDYLYIMICLKALIIVYVDGTIIFLIQFSGKSRLLLPTVSINLSEMAKRGHLGPTKLIWWCSPPYNTTACNTCPKFEYSSQAVTLNRQTHDDKIKGMDNSCLLEVPTCKMPCQVVDLIFNC